MDYQQQVLQAIQTLGAQNAHFAAKLDTIEAQNTEIRAQNVEIRAEMADVKARLQRIEENTIIIRDRVISQFQDITPETKAAIEQAAAKLIEDKIEEKLEATSKERKNGTVIPMTKLFNNDALLIITKRDN